MVSVSREALSQVRGALMDFNSDISGMAWRCSGKAEDIISESQMLIGQTVKTVDRLEGQIKTLIYEIEELENAIVRDTNEMNFIGGKIQQMKEALYQAQRQREDLQAQLAALRSQESDDEDVRQQIRAQIEMVEVQLNQVECTIGKLSDDIRDAERQEDGLRKSINASKAKRAEAEVDLSVLKKKCSGYQSKLERQKVAGKRLESDLYAYVDAMKRLEVSSSGTARDSASAVEACITSIDGYMSVNL